MVLKIMNKTKEILTATDNAFFSFLSILTGLMVISVMLWVWQSEVPQKVVDILGTVVTGLMTLAGMGAQAIFRQNKTDEDFASAARTRAEKALPMTGEAKVIQDETKGTTE